MSTPSTTVHLMGRSNITMAVAQPKPKSAPKANANAATSKAAKVQMHRRSRTGVWDLSYFRSLFLVVAYDKSYLLTHDLPQAATPAD
jgi:hypothetical protein